MELYILVSTVGSHLCHRGARQVPGSEEERRDGKNRVPKLGVTVEYRILTDNLQISNIHGKSVYHPSFPLYWFSRFFLLIPFFLKGSCGRILTTDIKQHSDFLQKKIDPCNDLKRTIYSSNTYNTSVGHGIQNPNTH